MSEYKIQTEVMYSEQMIRNSFCSSLKKKTRRHEVILLSHIKFTLLPNYNRFHAWFSIFTQYIL